MIDYEIADFPKIGKQYDLILDCKSSRSVFSILRSLSPGGTYVTIGGKLWTLVNLLLWGKLCSSISTKKIRIQSLRPNDGLDKINSLFKEGKIKSAVDGPYSLEDIPTLVSYFGAGAHKGKVVIKVK